MIKIGVLGAGHLGKIHSKLLREIRGFSLVGIYDIEPKQSQTLAQEVGVTPFATAQELMEAVDAVDIVTPTTTHFQYAQMAIRQGRHVFVEKPLAQTLDEAAQLVQLVGEAKVKGMVGHVERFNPALLAARPFIKKPMFIESHRLAQFNPRGTDVPVVLDLMIHDLDVIRHLVGEPVRRISASGVAVVSGSPDIANARIEFTNGSVANLTASRISMKQMRKMRIFQHEGYISVDFLDKKAEIIRISDYRESANPFALELTTANGSRWIHFERPDVMPINSIKWELEMFLEAIMHDKQAPVTFHDGYEAMHLAHQVMEQIDRLQPH